MIGQRNSGTRVRTSMKIARRSLVFVLTAVVVVLSSVPDSRATAFPADTTSASTVSSVSLPADNFSTILAEDGSLWAFGTSFNGIDSSSNVGCVLAKISEEPFRVEKINHYACEYAYALPVASEVIGSVPMNVEFGRPSFADQLHMMTVDEADDQLSFGPVLYNSDFPSLNRLGQAYGDGLFFLGHENASGGPTASSIQELSTVNGDIERTIQLPSAIATYSLLPDADGLFVVVGHALGLDAKTALLYLVPPGSSTPMPVSLPGVLSVTWAVASGPHVYAEVITAGDVFKIVRLDGARAREAYQVPVASANTPIPSTVIGDESDGLWSLIAGVPPRHQALGASVCNAVEEVVYIDPTTGQVHDVATLPPGIIGVGDGCASYNLGGGQGVVVGKKVLLLGCGGVLRRLSQAVSGQ